MARSRTDRLAETTVERQFRYEMETDFELAPAASRAVLATAQQVLLVSGGEPRQQQMLAGRVPRLDASAVDDPCPSAFNARAPNRPWPGGTRSECPPRWGL